MNQENFGIPPFVLIQKRSKPTFLQVAFLFLVPRLSTLLAFDVHTLSLLVTLGFDVSHKSKFVRLPTRLTTAFNQTR